jgi:hypothetical protein
MVLSSEESVRTALARMEIFDAMFQPPPLDGPTDPAP